MKIEIQNNAEKQERIFRIEGELDVHQVKNLKSMLMADLEKFPNWTYMLDMENVVYLDSSGLGTLIYLKKELKSKGGKLKLQNLKEQVLNVFRMTKLEEFFEISSGTKV